ncbi:MAG: hypothetical protein IJD04_05780 [Desulfovibrionaceae bacterium]|nr:hypothetical protein [Desulfovibrionaceae bacterium]
MSAENSAALDLIVKSGWKTAWIADALTAELMDGAGSISEEGRLRLAERLKENLSGGGMVYNLNLHPIMQELKPLLPPEAEYYAWNLDWDISDPGLESRLEGLNGLSKLLVGFKTPWDAD